MENQHQHLKKSEAQAKDMVEFFHDEFQTLRSKTGIRQWEQLNEQPNAAKAIHDVIDFMCQVCNKPPFHVVRPEVKQRVIARAIVEDTEFIGLNAKFVQKALGSWWAVNGDRVMEAMNQTKPAEPVELTAEQKRKIDQMANKYVEEILRGDGPQIIPKMEPEVAKKEGAEWDSNIERKGISYPLTTIEQAQNHELHLEWIRQNFDKYTGDKLPTWKEESEWINNLSESEKDKIYYIAGI